MRDKLDNTHPWSVRGADGTFQRKHEPWTPENWDDGWVDNDGRFMVYRPDYPKCDKLGHAKRSRVVWWLNYGEAPGSDYCIHHINGDKLDDRIKNLEKFTRGEHTVKHCKGPRIKRICQNCGAGFEVIPSRVYGKERGNRNGFCAKYCSGECRKAKHSEAMKLAWARRRAKSK